MTITSSPYLSGYENILQLTALLKQNEANVLDIISKANSIGKYNNYKKRNYQKKSNYEVIGFINPALILQYGDKVAATTVKADFTTYPDRAILQFKNNTASDIFLLGGSIRGERILKISGDNGYFWEYSDYESIDRDGETFEKVESDYIVNPVQCKQVGDYTWKESRPHKQYTLTLQGCQYNYEIGDVYSLSISYTLQTSAIENISSDVEIIGVTFNRPVDGVGTTELIVRVPSPTWTLTTNTLARLVNAGAPTRLENRSNVVTVASSSWVGQADYFCDGTDDNVEIQKAINYLDSIGGGLLALTSGIFNISDVILYESNITIEGQGGNTVIKQLNTTSLACFNGVDKQNVILRDFDITSNSTALQKASSLSFIINRDSEYDTLCKNIQIYGFYCEEFLVGFNNITNCSTCKVYDMHSDSACVGFYECMFINSCKAYEIYGTLSATNAGFSVCWNLTNCEAKNIKKVNNTSDVGFMTCYKLTNCTSDSNNYGFYSCKSVQQCRSNSDATGYSLSYADSGTSNACADTSAGGYNS